jgi:hypothetical protein
LAYAPLLGFGGEGFRRHGRASECGLGRRVATGGNGGPATPSSGGAAQNLASQPGGCSLLTFVRPNGAHASKPNQSAPGTHALGHRRCRLAVRTLATIPRMPCGASKGAGEADSVCLYAHGLHRAARAVGPLEPPSQTCFGADRGRRTPHPHPKPSLIPGLLSFGVV